MTPITEPISGTLSVQALRARRLAVMVPLGLVMLGVLFLDVVRWSAGQRSFPPVVGSLVFASLVLGPTWVIVTRRWAAWSWQLIQAEREVLVVEQGLWTRKWQAVPIDRLQFVETASGPLQRQFALSTLVLRTAGAFTPAINLEDLDHDVAESLRDRLSRHLLQPHDAEAPEARS